MELLLILWGLTMDGWTQDETISAYAMPGATYVLEDLNGTAPPGRVTIRFPGEGRVEGEGPCNGYAAEQTVPYPWIRIGAVVATRRACPALAFEALYFKSLQAATLAEAFGDVLILSDPGGLEIVFRAEE